MRYVKHYIANERALLDLVPLFIVTCEKNGNPIAKEAKPWIPRYLMARLLNLSTIPSHDSDNEWDEIERQFDSRFPPVSANVEATE